MQMRMTNMIKLIEYLNNFQKATTIAKFFQLNSKPLTNLKQDANTHVKKTTRSMLSLEPSRNYKKK